MEHWDIGISGTEIAVDGRSVYAKVVEGRERLDRLREGIRKELTKRNLVNGGFSRKPPDPHVTLLKSRHQREIDPMCYSDVADLDFGLQRCHSVQLLSMNGRGRPSDGGYYTILGQVLLGKEDIASSMMAEMVMLDEEHEENHKECCAPLKPEFGTQEVRSLQLLDRRSSDDDKMAEVELAAVDRVDGHDEGRYSML